MHWFVHKNVIILAAMSGRTDSCGNSQEQSKNWLKRPTSQIVISLNLLNVAAFADVHHGTATMLNFTSITATAPYILKCLEHTENVRTEVSDCKVSVDLFSLSNFFVTSLNWRYESVLPRKRTASVVSTKAQEQCLRSSESPPGNMTLVCEEKRRKSDDIIIKPQSPHMDGTGDSCSFPASF